MIASADRTDAVAVVVVNWNSWQLSLECLRSLRQSEGARWHLFLVDNASTDDSRAHLEDLGDDVTLLLAAENGGWTGGNNIGVKAALAAGYDTVFILNNDATVKPDTLARLVRADAGDARPPVLGPIHLDGEEGRPDFVGAAVNPATGMPLPIPAYRTDVRSLAAFYPTAYIRGAGLFARRVHFEEVGLFDDRYYLNYDETDWCFRLRAKGFGVLMMRDAEIVHLGSGSIGGVTSPLNVYFLTRNGLLFAEEHCSPQQRIQHTAALARWAVSLSGRPTRQRRLIATIVGRERTTRAFRAGVRDYLLRRFGNCPPSIRALSGSR